MNIATTSRRRGSETAWLDAALEVLTEAGVDAVRVMPLAQRLGLARTGFYWHFKDREALLDAMIRRWEDRNTGPLVTRCEAYADSLGEAMFNLFDCWLDRDLFDAPLDLAIRNWARTDPALQARLDRADARRQAAVAAMFARFGCPAAEAEVRAMTVIYTQIGYFSMRVTEDRQTRLARMPAYVAVFTGRQPSARDIRRFMARHRASGAIRSS